MTFPLSEIQSCQPIVVPDEDVRPRIQKHSYYLRVPIDRSEMESCPSTHGLRRHVSPRIPPRIQQDSDHPAVTMHRSAMKRCPTISALRPQVRARIPHHPDRRLVTIARSVMQSRRGHTRLCHPSRR